MEPVKKKHGAQPGNRNNHKGLKWRGAIRRALYEYTQGGVEKGKALNAIAHKLVEDALSNDLQARHYARKEIGDRLDGRAHESVALSGPDGQPVVTGIAVTLVKPDADQGGDSAEAGAAL